MQRKGYFWKKIVAIGISLLSVMEHSLTFAYSETGIEKAYKDYEYIEPSYASLDISELSELKESYGYVDVPYEIFRIDKDKGDTIPIEQKVQLPSFYDAREHQQVTSVKRQNPWGNCWSFATLSALESSLLSSGYSEDIDLSEYHLNYYSYKSVTDPLKGTQGDSVAYNGTFEKFLNAGGNVLVAYHALTNWMGAANETIIEYPSQNPKELEDTIESAYLNDIVHVQQMYQINKADTEAVKKEIMEHGAVTAAFFYNAKYFNSSTGAYYNNIATNSNHGVVIVGWDDNYSKDNFKTAPLEDGAWLVKNSWGTDFGKSGYIWLSYEDTSLQDAMCVLIGEDADNYDNNYQYDGSYMNSQLKIPKEVIASNIFQVQGEDTREELKAVAFELGNTNVNYEIQIYTNIKEEGNPFSGTPRLQEPVTGSTVYQGYYTVNLPEPVLLNPQETFAVVIRFTKEDNISLTIERSTIWNNTQFVASAKENQSLISRDNGESWTDIGAKYAGNIRIKAFTNNTNLSPYVPVEGITLETEADNLELNVGETKTLKAYVLPQNADNQTILWNSLDSTVAEIDENGTLTAKKKGKTTIVCQTQEGGYQAELEVIVQDVIALQPVKSDLTVGESLQFQILVNGILQSFEENKNYDWEVSKEDVLQVSSDGVITGIGAGSCIVSCYTKEDRQEDRQQASAEVVIYTNFKDIRTSDWQYPFVINVYKKGLMVGKSPQFFGVNNPLRRSEFITMLYALSGKPQVNYQSYFSDVREEDWFALPVIWAYEGGITAGYGGGNFGSMDEITREQLVLMLYRYAEKMNYSLDYQEGNLEKFPDKQEVSNYAVKAMDWAVEKGMISGRGNKIVPQGIAARGECAAILTRFLEEVY